MSEQTGGLAKKLAKILAEVEQVKATGENKFHGYKYVTESDLLKELRPRLAKMGVFVFSSIEGHTSEHYTTTDKNGNEKIKIITTVKTKHTMMDGDSGESFVVYSAGQGEDAGDKGIYKAFTGAAKYFWMKTFMLSAGDDPENGKGGGDGDSGRRKSSGRKAAGGNGLISEAQAKRLYAIATGTAGWSSDELHAFLRKKGFDKPGDDPTRNVTKSSYEKVVGFVEAHHKPKDSEPPLDEPPDSFFADDDDSVPF